MEELRLLVSYDPVMLISVAQLLTTECPVPLNWIPVLSPHFLLVKLDFIGSHDFSWKFLIRLLNIHSDCTPLGSHSRPLPLGPKLGSEPLCVCICGVCICVYLHSTHCIALHYDLLYVCLPQKSVRFLSTEIMSYSAINL